MSLHDEEETTDALSLTENFAREPMHPLDEAEAFAKLASADAKGHRRHRRAPTES